MRRAIRALLGGRTAQILRLAVALGLLAVPVECARVVHLHSLFQTTRALAESASARVAADPGPAAPHPTRQGISPHAHGPAAQAARASVPAGATVPRLDLAEEDGIDAVSSGRGHGAVGPRFWSPLAAGLDGSGDAPSDRRAARGPAGRASARVVLTTGLTSPEATTTTADDPVPPAGVLADALPGRSHAPHVGDPEPDVSARADPGDPVVRQMTTAVETAAGMGAAVLVAALPPVGATARRAPLRAEAVLTGRVIAVSAPPPRRVLARP